MKKSRSPRPRARFLFLTAVAACLLWALCLAVRPLPAGAEQDQAAAFGPGQVIGESGISERPAVPEGMDAATVAPVAPGGLSAGRPEMGPLSGQFSEQAAQPSPEQPRPDRTQDAAQHTIDGAADRATDRATDAAQHTIDAAQHTIDRATDRATDAARHIIDAATIAPAPAPQDAAAPASADTVGPAPAPLPAEDDLPAAEDVSPVTPKIRLFGTVEFKRPLSSLPGWLDLLKRNQADPIFVPEKHFNKKITWRQFKEKAKGKSPMELLRYVNSFWNFWPYREDMENWGREDYWEIPAEFIKRSGDCEDYAIIKYFTLKELGISPETMRIVVIRDAIRNMAHAVLVVCLGNDAYVLDNLSNAILSHTRFKHYNPQYSVNEFGRWAHLRGRKLK